MFSLLLEDNTKLLQEDSALLYLEYNRVLSILASSVLFVFSGVGAGVLKGSRVGVSVGEFILSGIDVGTIKDWRILSALGTIVLTGKDVSFSRTYVLEAIKNTISFLGISVRLLKRIGLWIIDANGTSSFSSVSKPTNTFLTTISKPTSTWNTRIETGFDLLKEDNYLLLQEDSNKIKLGSTTTRRSSVSSSWSTESKL